MTEFRASVIVWASVIAAVGAFAVIHRTERVEAHPLSVEGAINPEVTQANIDSTICAYGWTRTIRPPVSYTSPIKRWLIQNEQLPGRMSDYILDHKEPLELGGDPYDVRNLQIQTVADARAKDREENRLNHLVCSHQMPLEQAQQIMRHEG